MRYTLGGERSYKKKQQPSIKIFCQKKSTVGYMVAINRLLKEALEWIDL